MSALLPPADRPTEPMPDDDGAPTELWERPVPQPVRVTWRYASAMAPRPAARVGSIAPVAFEPVIHHLAKGPASPRGSGDATFALGAVVIGAAACVGLALGHYARVADLGARSSRAGVATPAPSAAQERASTASAAPVTVSVDALPSVAIAEKDTASRPSGAALPPSAELDRAAATAVIARVAAVAAGCDGAEGALVRVTFAPSGRVSSVTGDALASGSRACVAAAFRGAAIAPFRGAPVTVAAAIAR